MKTCSKCGGELADIQNPWTPLVKYQCRKCLAVFNREGEIIEGEVTG